MSMMCFMRWFITLTLLAFLALPLGVLAQEPTPTPIQVVVTVILVWPTATETPTPTETLTPTDGPSPTPTFTPTATPQAEFSVNVGGQDLIIRNEVTPGAAAIVGFLAILVGFEIVALFRRRPK